MGIGRIGGDWLIRLPHMRLDQWTGHEDDKALQEDTPAGSRAFGTLAVSGSAARPQEEPGRISVHGSAGPLLVGPNDKQHTNQRRNREYR